MKGKSPGSVVSLTAPTGGVTRDTPVMVGGFFGMPHNTAAAGASFELITEGEFTFPKATGAAWAEGDVLYHDSASQNLTKTRIGPAVAKASAAATSGATTGRAIIIKGAPSLSARTLNVMDDDSAASNGTAVNVVQLDSTNRLFLESTTANDASVTVQVDEADDYIVVGDNDSPGGVQLYVDEDADGGSQLLANLDGAIDGYLVTAGGRMVRVKHDASPTGEGVALYVDDDAADKTERFLFVSPTNADATVELHAP